MAVSSNIKSGASKTRPAVQPVQKSAKQIVFERLVGDSTGALDWLDVTALRRRARPILTEVLREQKVKMPDAERKALLNVIAADLINLGPLALWLEDNHITEIMVVNHEKVFVSNKGRMERSQLHFQSEEHLRGVIDHLLAPLQIQLNEARQLFDGRVADGEFYNGDLRVSAAIPPLAVDGSTLTIAKFGRVPLTVQNVIDYGSVTVEMMEYLRACVIAGSNILISGDAGSGRTTLLNILSGFIPADERIVTVEPFTQLELRQEHVIRLEAPLAATANAGDTSLRDLLRHALSMRPERVVVGELRGGETLDWLLAMNRGVNGSMGALRAKSPRDALARLETLGQMAGADWNPSVLRDLLAFDLNLIVHMERLRDGTRKIVHISEIQGLEKGEVALADVFTFEQTGRDDRRILGRFQATGVRPKNLASIGDAGIRLWQLVYAIKPERIDQFRNKSRRLHAEFPGQLAVGEIAILRVNLGPVDEKAGNESAPSEFPIDPKTGQPEKIEIDCSVLARNFEIDAPKQSLTINPNGTSASAEFSLTARKEGSTGLFVGADRGRESLGHIWLETVITPPRKARQTSGGKTVSGSIYLALNTAESCFRPWYET